MSAKTQMQEILRKDLSHAEAAREIAKGTISPQNWVVTSDRPGFENFVVISNGSFFYGYQQGPVPTFTIEDANYLATGKFNDGQGFEIPLKVVTAAAFHDEMSKSFQYAIEQLDRIPQAFQ